MNTIKIKPVNYPVDTLNIISVGIALNKSAYISCVVSGKDITINHNIELTPEEYSAWGNDDNYILDLIFSKLGLEKS